MLNKFKYDIGKEIESNIYTSLKASIKNDAKDSFFSIDGFILQSINTFFREDRIIEFINFLKLVEQYYTIPSVLEKQNDSFFIIFLCVTKIIIWKKHYFI